MTSGNKAIVRFMCCLVILAGIAAYGVTIAMDTTYGRNVAVSEIGSNVQMSAMLIVSLFAFAFAGLSGLAFRAGHRKFGIAVMLLTLLYMAYSAKNGVGFVATESIGKQRLVSAKAKQSKQLAEARSEQAIKSRTATLDWLKSTFTAKSSAEDRDRVRSSVIELSEKPLPEAVPTEQEAMADAAAEVMSRWSGLDVEDVQISNAVWLIALVVLGKVLGPAIGFAFWPSNSEPPPETFTQVSEAGAKSDVSEQIQRGNELCFEEYAERWQVSKATAGRRITDFCRQGICRWVQRGHRKVVVAPLVRTKTNGAARLSVVGES